MGAGDVGSSPVSANVSADTLIRLQNLFRYFFFFEEVVQTPILHGTFRKMLYILFFFLLNSY